MNIACPLQPRQIEILQLLADGKMRKTIAHDLRITKKTVDTQVSRALELVDKHTVTGLVAEAVRQGWVK